MYSVDVMGEGPGGREGCGSDGRTIIFEIGAQYMAPMAPWDTSQVHYLALQPMHHPSAPDVSIQRDGEALVLSWPAVIFDTADRATLVTTYRIWRSTQPYFDPALPDCDCVNIANVADLIYTDAGSGDVEVVGDVNVNYSYVVKAVNAVGESSISNRVGEFDFALAPGSQQ